MQQSTNRRVTSFDPPKHRKDDLSDPWGFKIQEGRSFVGSGEDVPFNMELKPFNLGESENVCNR